MQPLERVAAGALRQRRLREGGEPVDLRLDIEVWILAPGDGERGAPEVDVGVGPGDFAREFLQRRIGAHQQPGA